MPIIGAKTGKSTGVKRSVWQLPGELDRDMLAADLGRAFIFEAAPAETLCSAWFDTFDWRLFSRGCILCHDGTTWNLIDRATGETITAAGAGPVRRTVFSADLPAGPLRRALEPVVEMRCLQTLFAEELTMYMYRMLNSDAKTVAFAGLAEHRFQPGGSVYRTVNLEGVRGYNAAYAALRKFFRRYGIREAAEPYAFFSEGARSRGRRPLDYSSKFTLALRPEMSSLEAVKAVYRRLLVTLRWNEQGIVEDLDTEFLHDFRVAVRRTRSGLGQVKDVIPAAVNVKAKATFAWLGAITGPSRDLDVYLLQEDAYRLRLPQCLHNGLRHYFAEIRARREVERKKLVRHLRSKKYRRIIAEWQSWLDNEENGEVGAHAQVPVIDLASDIILRRFRSIIRKGAKIGLSSPDSELHRLRIQCKKLRYILEFFASLYPEPEINAAIRQLRRLQGNLGDFNDLSVQQELLRQYLASLPPGSGRNQEKAAALGGLLTSLYHEQRRVRRSFAKRYREFSRPGNMDVYRKLFGSQA